MGTKGYRVWRHKGRFLSQFDTGAYPSDLGMKHWDSVPKDPAEVEGWVQQTRLWVEEKMKSLDATGGDVNEEWQVHARSEDIWRYDWDYEIDLDNLIFRVNELPMYNLLRMPLTPETFLALEDEQGMMFVYDKIPSENRWDSDMQLFVRPVDKELLAAYVALECTVSASIVPPPPDNETTKVRRMWAQSFVMELRATRLFVSAIFKAHTLKDTDKLGDTIRDVLNFLHHVILRPPIALDAELRRKLPYSFYRLERPRLDMSSVYSYGSYWESRTDWIRANLCVHFQPHLEDEANLHAGVVRVVRAIAGSALPQDASTVYGVLNSITHCAVVSYDVKSRTVRHTGALRLLPPWHYESLDDVTPGMLALTSLCQHLDSADGGYPDFVVPKTVNAGRLPFDVLSHIAGHIEHTVTLFSFAAASSVCKLAAKSRLMLPKLDHYIVEACAEGREVYCADGDTAGLIKYWKSPGEYLGVNEVLSLFTLVHGKYYE